ncbi:MAG: phenylacetic acid degradation operon negative regulatory protein PaaX [Proteobacteria bacterium]|nr:phenylacetic acid degradation operon negative regulatory protein PaaX [Pseudomonadota bacterium]
MNEKTEIDGIIKRLLESLDLKARSLLVTVWGDCVAPHGGTVWLRSLIKLVEPLGLNERVVRTSVFRLQKDGLLTSEQMGRRSFYSLTPSGQHRFAEATHRIYATGDLPWNDQWLLLLLSRRELPEPQRRLVDAELNWLGFGSFGSGIYAHPTATADVIKPLFTELNITSSATLLEAAAIPDSDFASQKTLVQKGWNLDSLEANYGQFIDNFSALSEKISHKSGMDEKKCFIIRSLLVHDYRRVLLRDPMLPAKLLPAGWNGNKARTLFREIYQQVWQDAEKHLMSVLENSTGRLPPASEEFKARFGGLKVNE